MSIYHIFGFKFDFVKFCNSNIEDFENLFNILTLDNMPGFIEKSKVPFNSIKNLVANRYLDVENNEREEVNSACDFVSGELSEDNSNDCEVVQETDDNRAKLKDNRLEGKFVSKNVINLSQRQLTKSEISLLSKGLKFVPTPNRIDKAKLKQELEVFGRKLRLMWHFRNDERTFDCNKKFRQKSTFNPKNTDVIIETYLSSLEEKLLDNDIPKDKSNNLSKEERDTLYSFKKVEKVEKVKKAKKVESWIKDTNHFPKKLKELGSLPKSAILCTADVVGLYPNIPHEEGLASN